MITYYLDVLEDKILIGIDSDEKDDILDLLSDFYGTDFEPTEVRDTSTFMSDTVVVTQNLADEAFITVMLENDINVYVTS
jgi:hypothetical protein